MLSYFGWLQHVNQHSAIQSVAIRKKKYILHNDIGITSQVLNCFSAFSFSGTDEPIWRFLFEHIGFSKRLCPPLLFRSH